jgi:hypothetical protein
VPTISAESNRVQVRDEIGEEVRRRFPLLQALKFSDLSNSSSVCLPGFIGLLATLLESANKPCCVILPDVRGVALGVSSLVAISRLQSEFADILRAHASVAFKDREDNVLVHPSGLVYRYQGFFTPTLFRLGVIDRRDCRSLPVQEIVRLEKTTRRRPKGKLDSDLGQSRLTVLGALLGVRIPLNRNFLRNYVLVLGARKTFVEELDGWRVQITDKGVIDTALKEEVPFGKVLESGKLAFLDGYIPEGEPLVAVASRVEDLAAFCRRAESFQKQVVVDDINLLTRDLRAYDDISETQRTLILATDCDRDSVRMLKDRGCEVWRLTPDEMLSGLNPQKQEGPFRQIVKKASNMRQLVISELPCGEENLDRAVVKLTDASDALSSADNGAIRELLFSCFRLVMFCAEYLGQNPERFLATGERLLQLARQHLRNGQVWLAPKIEEGIKTALEDLHVAIAGLSKCSVTPKGRVLLDSLANARLQQRHAAAIVTRAETDFGELTEWLKRAGVESDIYRIGELPEDLNFDQLLVVSWPRSVRFDALTHQYSTDDLRLLAYPFERRWLNQYRTRYQRSLSSLSGVSPKRKRQLVGLSGATIEENEGDSVRPADVVKFDLPEEQFLLRRKIAAIGGYDPGDQEEFVDASYVDFTGTTFAYLTEGHVLPVLNGFISQDAAAPGKIPLRTVEQLKAGDYVAFRESGDSDIIRFLAEDEVGKDSYQHLRSTAGRWRIALRKLGEDPKTVWEQLKNFGFSRHLQTVRGWLVDESRICPQDLEDVRKIAGASHDAELLAMLPEVQQAKDRIMSLHISAGSRLTELLLRELPSKIGQLSYGATEVDLGVGKVWIVRVQEMDRSPSAQRRSQVNRLLWEERGV